MEEDKKITEDAATHINLLSKIVHQGNVDRGFWDEENPNIGEKLMLMVSELGEACEADRKGQRANIEKHFRISHGLNPEDSLWQYSFNAHVKDTLEDELADTIIRIIDFAGKYNIPIGDHIQQKLNYNSTRPHKHGKKY